jgi:hypothetical protein
MVLPQQKAPIVSALDSRNLNYYIIHMLKYQDTLLESAHDQNRSDQCHEFV